MKHHKEGTSIPNEQHAPTAWELFYQDPRHEELVLDYERLVEPLEGMNDIKDTLFYKQALAHFSIPKNIRILWKLVPSASQQKQIIELITKCLDALEEHNFQRQEVTENSELYQKFFMGWENCLFDEDLLLRLIFASHSSSFKLSLNEEWKENPSEQIWIDVEISVTNDDASITKTLSELHSIQIANLYKIYLDEQMRMVVITVKDEDEDIEELLRSKRQKQAEYSNAWLEALVQEANTLLLLSGSSD